MEDGTNLIYIIINKLYNNQISTRAICTNRDEYSDYVRTHDMNGMRTLVLNADHPKITMNDKFMEKLYDSNYTIVDYYGDVPLTGYEEEMLIENEGTFHQHIKSKINDITNILKKDYIKFSKEEKRDIEHMLNIIRNKNGYCVDEEDVSEDDPSERINYNELIKQSKILN